MYKTLLGLAMVHKMPWLRARPVIPATASASGNDLHLGCKCKRRQQPQLILQPLFKLYLKINPVEVLVFRKITHHK